MATIHSDKDIARITKHPYVFCLVSVYMYASDLPLAHRQSHYFLTKILVAAVDYKASI